jgi:predicted RNA methylase
MNLADNISDSPTSNHPAFSSIDCIGQCMMDRERSEAFERAINEAVTPSDHVLDVGTGSGLLALLAARRGARQVTAMEFDPYVAGVAKTNFQSNNVSEVADVLVANAKSHEFSAGTHFDVVIMELLTTGLIDESQVKAINNLHRQQVVRPSTRFIPCRQDTFVFLGNMQFELLGLEMKMVRHLWSDFYDEKDLLRLTQEQILHSINFCSPCPESYSGNVMLEVFETGVVNALVFTSTTALTPTISVGSTLAMNAPVVFPLPARPVMKGQQVSLSLAYRFGDGFGNMVAELH